MLPSATLAGVTCKAISFVWDRFCANTPRPSEIITPTRLPSRATRSNSVLTKKKIDTGRSCIHLRGGWGGITIGRYSGGKGRGLRGTGIEDGDTAGVRGRESTTLCQFPFGLLSTNSTSSDESANIGPGGLCTSFTVSSAEEARDTAPKRAVSSASFFSAKNRGTLSARGRLESFVVELVEEEIRHLPQVARKFAKRRSARPQ